VRYLAPLLANADTQSPGALQIIFAGGMTGAAILVVLVGMSMIAMALTVEHLLAIRRRVLMPDQLADDVRRHLETGKLSEAATATRASPSALAAVLAAGLGEAAGGWPAVEKAMEETLAEQAARLFRKIDYLSVIGNIAPMLGLLGTVVGMIFAFREVADTQGAARAAELAGGIYQALVTTVGGLLVAIPSFAAFAVFRNRIDQLLAETATQAQQAMRPLKQLLLHRAGESPTFTGNLPTPAVRPSPPPQVPRKA
jgi:biopolymer transport protein ExbB